MIEYSELITRDIKRFMMGVPNTIIRNAVIDALYRFFDDSGSWTEKQRLSAYDTEVVVFPNDPYNTYIIGVKYLLTLGGSPIPYEFENGNLTLGYKPNSEINVEFKLANNKGSSRCSTPDWVYNQHNTEILHLATYLIKTQTEMPWGDAQGASYHLAEYKRALGESIIKKTPNTVKMRPFV